jgi:ABC-type methionine transport system ATPase subunit
MEATVSRHLFLSFPETLVKQPLIFTAAKRFDVLPNIRRANVEEHSGWVVLELDGADDAVQAAVDFWRESGVQVNRMEGDILSG